MVHIGIDMHKSVSQAEVMNGAGETIDCARLQHRDYAQLKAFFQSYSGDGIATLEATRNWYWPHLSQITFPEH